MYIYHSSLTKENIRKNIARKVSPNFQITQKQWKIKIFEAIFQIPWHKLLDNTMKQANKQTNKPQIININRNSI